MLALLGKANFSHPGTGSAPEAEPGVWVEDLNHVVSAC